MCGHMYVEVRVLGVGFLHHMGSRDGTSVVRLGSNRPPCPTLSPALRRSFYIATEKQCSSERVTEVQGHECRRWDRAWMTIWDRKGRQSQLYRVSSEMLWRRGYFGLQLGKWSHYTLHCRRWSWVLVFRWTEVSCRSAFFFSGLLSPTATALRAYNNNKSLFSQCWRLQIWRQELLSLCRAWEY